MSAAQVDKALDKAKEVNHDARNKANAVTNDAKDTAKAAANDARDKANAAGNAARDKAIDAKNTAEDAANNAKEKTKEVGNEVKAKSNDALSYLFNGPIDKAVTRIVKVLSSSAGVDATFCLIGYGSVLTSAQLQILTRYVAKTTTKATLLNIALSAKNLGVLCSDVRTFLRLWGLLKIYLGAKAAYYAPPKDGLLKLLSVSQLASMTGYFWYENSAYLAGKGVLRGAGFTPLELGAKMQKAIYLYGFYLVLDFIRLYRTTQIAKSAASAPQKNAVAASHGGEKDVALHDETALAKRHAEEAAWWKSLKIDLSYFPLCFHWSGLAPIPPQYADLVAGALCSVAGYVSFKDQLALAA